MVELAANRRELNIQRKRRAPRACFSCRSRKVRCDVVFRGTPCTNCTLDQETCLIPSNRPKCSRLQSTAQHQQTLPEASLHQCRQRGFELQPVDSALSHAKRYHGEQQALEAKLSQLTQSQYDEFFDFDKFFAALDNEESMNPASLIQTPEDYMSPSGKVQIQQASAGDKRNAAQDGLPWVALSPTICNSPSPMCGLFTSARPPPFCSRVSTELSRAVFKLYHFISTDEFLHLDERDSQLLEQRLCLHLPTKPALYEFLRHYFLHVHPIFPIINERAFWAIYNDSSSQTSHTKRIPLVVLQGMIFLACPFVSQRTLEDLGFGSVRQARVRLYLITKTLFHINEDKDDVTSAQVALMLTFHAPAIYDKVDGCWLKTAIYFAKKASADRYKYTGADLRYEITLKRLWWCCILRDRIMALCLQRPLRIKPEDFDFSQPGLLAEDLDDEVSCSEVYDPSIKKVLVQLVASLCELVVTINDLLIFCQSSRSKPDGNGLGSQKHLEILSGLDQWHEKAKVNFQRPALQPGLHESFILFASVLDIYYHTARASLNYHVFHQVRFHGDADCDLLQIWHASEEVKRCLHSIAQVFVKLKDRNLARYLPNTFVAFSLRPFIWHTSKLGKNEDSVMRDNGDSYLYDTLRNFGQSYEVTDSVLQGIGISEPSWLSTNLSPPRS